MGLLFSLLLIILGLLAAQDFFLEKQPAMRKFYNALDPYAGYIGFAGLLCGVIWLLDGFTLLRLFPMMAFSIWGLSLLMMALGLLFGLDTLRKFTSEPPSPFILTAAQWRIRLLPYRKELGLAAIVFGIIYIL